MTTRDADATLGQRLRAARVRKKLSQEELAAKLGGKTNRWTVSRWEKDEHVPGERNQVKLTRLLDLDPGLFPAAAEERGSLARRVGQLEQVVGRLERHIFGEGAVPE